MADPAFPDAELLDLREAALVVVSPSSVVDATPEGFSLWLTRDEMQALCLALDVELPSGRVGLWRKIKAEGVAGA